MAEVMFVGDVGGTNTNLAVVRHGDDGFKILHQSRHSSKEIHSFTGFINEQLKLLQESEGFDLRRACFAAAGPVRDNVADMTNVNFDIDAEDIVVNTMLEQALVINDFEAIAYAVDILTPDDIIVLNEGEVIPEGTMAVVGAGTGLGKAMLFYSYRRGIHIPRSSEGGGCDLPYHGEKERELVRFIKRQTGAHHAEYEDVLSGKGLEKIYSFLRSGYHQDQPVGLGAEEISETRNDNPCSKEAFEMFVRFYSRCCRNFALDTYSTGGMYVAGGIAAKNVDAFDTFMDDFSRHVRFRDLLEKIPVILIKNYDVSLLGAAHALEARQDIVARKPI